MGGGEGVVGVWVKNREITARVLRTDFRLKAHSYQCSVELLAKL